MKHWVKGMALVMTLVLAACGGKPEEAATGEKIYSMGVNAAFAPFESVGSDGKLQGFEIELAQAVSDAAGIKIKMTNTPWEGIFNGLANGDSDFLMSAITITEQRKQSMDFSEPYFDATQLVVLGKGQSISRAEQIKGMKVSVLTGSTGDTIAQKIQGATSTDIRRFESLELALKELENGGVQATIGDNGVVANYLTNNGRADLDIVEGINFDKEYYGMAVRKGDSALLEKLNAGIKQVRADGTYVRIHEKYFGKL
ncbi:basic amino acid ABC transporter substrate-binding protein [Craterilacuibacter sp.]|uniref:basic amino acid ABC transporter substrate-binding protein n=1 Tax=Craterilacuibacter sp. TaxID=2870909 RepID=UPI003F30432A